MAGEPGYIKELKSTLKDITGKVSSAEDSIIRIETTLTGTLPDIKSGRATLNGTVRKHETDLALQKQAHEECPARKGYGGAPRNPGPTGQWVIDLSETKGKATSSEAPTSDLQSRL